MLAQKMLHKVFFCTRPTTQNECGEHAVKYLNLDVDDGRFEIDAQVFIDWKTTWEEVVTVIRGEVAGTVEIAVAGGGPIIYQQELVEELGPNMHWVHSEFQCFFSPTYCPPESMPQPVMLRVVTKNAHLRHFD